MTNVLVKSFKGKSVPSTIFTILHRNKVHRNVVNFYPLGDERSSSPSLKKLRLYNSKATFQVLKVRLTHRIVIWKNNQSERTSSTIEAEIPAKSPIFRNQSKLEFLIYDARTHWTPQGLAHLSKIEHILPKRYDIRL